MKTIPFKDNKGRVVRLKAKATIEDLVRAGIEIKVARKGDPLPDGWMRSVPEPKAKP